MHILARSKYRIAERSDPVDRYAPADFFGSSNINNNHGGKMKYKNLILALISILILTNNAEASNKKIKVLLLIPPTVETILASETRSYITRELRSLKNVELLLPDKDITSLDYFLISIFPVSLKLSDGYGAGFTVSYVIEYKNDKIEHNVLVGGPHELKNLCEKIIAYFDTYWLEQERKKQK